METNLTGTEGTNRDLNLETRIVGCEGKAVNVDTKTTLVPIKCLVGEEAICGLKALVMSAS